MLFCSDNLKKKTSMSLLGFRSLLRETFILVCLLHKEIAQKLNLKVQSKFAVDDFFFFPQKIRLNSLCESSAWQTIHM